VCNPEEIWQMTDEMLIAQANWLPQYQGEIPKASERLQQAERNGKRVKLRDTQGAARLHTKSVKELAADQRSARANANAADKGNLTR
jgi:alpha-galactosidase